MTNENFEQAKYIRDTIDQLLSSKNKIELVKDRDDIEFKDIRQIAHDAICFCIKLLENKFEKL